MSRRKHAWAAWLEGQQDARAIEIAAIEDFLDDLMGELEALQGVLVNETLQGCMLAIRTVQRVADQWTERTI